MPERRAGRSVAVGRVGVKPERRSASRGPDPTGGRADRTPNRGCGVDGVGRLGAFGVGRTPNPAYARPRGGAYSPFGVPRTRRAGRAGRHAVRRVVRRVVRWRGVRVGRYGAGQRGRGGVPESGPRRVERTPADGERSGRVRERAGRRSSRLGGRPGPLGSVDPTERPRTSRPGRPPRRRCRARSARRTGHPGLG